jgi:hypothetical protein
MAYSAPRMAELNPLECSEEVDTILIGGLEHRDRLDVVHDRIGLPRLDAAGFDIAAMEETLSEEGERLQNAAGPVTAAVEAGAEIHTRMQDGTNGRRFPIDLQGRAALAPVQRILDSIGMEPELMADRAKLRHLLQTNAAAMKDWRRTYMTVRGGTVPQERQTGLADMMPWLLTHRSELHSLFHHLPYPELAMKQLAPKIVQQWGALEASVSTQPSPRGVLHAPTTTAPAAEYCRTGLAACTINDGDGQDRIVAGDSQRWARLQHFCPHVVSCARPENVPTECWNVLHTLPHALWAWPATSLGKVTSDQLGHHYYGQPAIRHLCEKVVERAAWGAAVAIPSGLTWDERITTMEAGLSAQPRY